MILAASMLFLALTRAEIIERFRAPPVTKVDGLVQVFADCPPDMRREYQLPVAGFVADVCRKLYAARMQKPLRFAEPGIVVHIGDVRTNVAEVVFRPAERPDGSRFARIWVPAPGYADMEALRTAAARGFLLAVDGEAADGARASAALRAADPELRVADERAAVKAWRERGEYADGMDDEAYLKAMRRVMTPGRASKEDVLVFASRLMLYPPYHAMPFCGKYAECTFPEAVELADRDPFVRLAALGKSTELLVFGGGRGDAMTVAAQAYSEFLDRLARRGGGDAPALRKMLADAEEKLKGVLEQ